MEVSALRYSGAAGRHGRSPLLKLQSDERLVGMVRRGNQGAFEVLVARYNARLLAFCRHMLGSREDAEDVLQDVFTASYNAMLADDRPINVRPWLYRIARNRCLNHLRRNRAIGVDSMDIHFAEHGASTADKVHEREEFRQLLHDIRDLPETQRTALALREMDALSYEQIAEAMETTVSSVKSLLVRARVSLTEAAEARLLSCDEVREELAEIAEGLRRKQSAPVRRHVKNCSRCEVFQGEMKKSSRALAALAPVGPLAFLHKLLFAHAAAHSAGSAGAGVAGAAGAGGAGSAGAAGAGAAGAGAAGAGAAGAAGGAGSAGLVTAGVGAVATKAAAGIAAAALVTAGTVAIDHPAHHQYTGPSASTIVQRSLSAGLQNALGSTHLPGAVGAGPGLSVAVLPARSAKAVKANVAHSALTVGSTVSRGSQATRNATSPATKPTRTDSTAQTHSTPVTTPPAANLQSSGGATPGANSTGGVGLAAGGNTATSATPTTDTTATTFTTSTPTDTTGAGTTATGTVTGTETAPTGTDTTTGTSTSPTTTAPTGTTTVPTGTTTAPTSTTTTPAATSTDPSTTADPSTTTDPSAPTTGTTTATP